MVKEVVLRGYIGVAVTSFTRLTRKERLYLMWLSMWFHDLLIVMISKSRRALLKKKKNSCTKTISVYVFQEKTQ